MILKPRVTDYEAAAKRRKAEDRRFRAKLSDKQRAQLQRDAEAAEQARAERKEKETR